MTHARLHLEQAAAQGSRTRLSPPQARELSRMHQLTLVAQRWPQLRQDSVVSELAQQLQAGQVDGMQAWGRLCREVLQPDQPFELHAQLFAAAYSSWPAEAGPPPVWVPQPLGMLHTNAARFMAAFQGDLQWEALRTGDPARDWPLLQRVSCANPDVFWGAMVRELQLTLVQPPSRMLQDDLTSADDAVWMPGARLNIASCALFCPKVADPSTTPAITWAAEGSPTQLRHVSWTELRQRCMHAAACIAARFEPGAALAIAMPLSVEAVVIYLAIVLAGCVVVSVADSFAATEVAARLRIAGAKAVFTQDVVLRGGKALPLYTRVVDSPAAPLTIVIPAAAHTGSDVQVALRAGDVLWSQFLASSPASHGAGAPASLQAQQLRPLPHIASAQSPTNILFSSGTTGEPKAIPWTHVTPLRCAVDGWSLQDIQAGDVVAWPTNLGWMMGPWLLYASLLNGATMALYQGAPLGRDFGEFVSAARVNVLGLVPSIVKAWRSSGCMARLDWRAHLRCFSSTGEASSPDDYHWLASRVAGYRPVIEYCGGTEIGGGFLAGCLLQPQAASAFSTPTLGATLVLLLPDGRLSPHGPAAPPATGELALLPPLLGSSQQLLNRDHREAYFSGMPRLCGRLLRRHGDEVQRLGGGYYRALGRCDDTMNLGGIKVSSVELERVLLQHVPSVSEVAAVGVAAPGGGPELLHLFVVPRQLRADDGAGAAAQLQQACSDAVRAHLNPLFKVERVVLVSALPRTASNKVMRRVLRDQVLQPMGKL